MKQKILFAISLFLFFTHQVLQKIFHINQSFIDSYLDPFLCMPILLYGLLHEQKSILKRHLPYALSFASIVIATLLIMFVGEYVFPRYSSAFTSDPLDLLAYLSGSLFFILFMNKAS